MKKLLSAFSSLSLAFLLFAPGVAQALMFDPVHVTLANPNQVVTAPSSGVTMLTFTGTVFIDPNYDFFKAFLDPAFNSTSSNSLSGTLDAAFLSFFATNNNGTYTGSLFEINVPAGTAPDLYAFEFMSANPSVITVEAIPVDTAYRADSVDGGFFVSDSAAFSVLVNAPANGVPDSGSTLLMLGAGVVALGFTQRMFVRVQAVAR